MKKFVVLMVGGLSLLSAGCIVFNSVDEDLFDKYGGDGGCYNVSDTFWTKSITTKVAGKKFDLYVHHYCSSTKNAKYVFYDMLEDKNISEPKDIPLIGSKIEAEFNRSYKNVKLKFEYDKDTIEVSHQEVECPWNKKYNFTERKISTYYPLFKKTTDIDSEEKAGSYYESINKCYTVSTDITTKHYVEYSTDNFAIRPDKFNVYFKQDSTFRGQYVPGYLIVENGYGDIQTNYSKNGPDLDIAVNDPDVKIQYVFDIYKGKLTPSSKIFFAKAGTDLTITVSERPGDEWAVVDSDDTSDECRLVSGTSNEINVTEPTKSWGGIGTGESENDPMVKNVNTDIRQNITKDLRFQKMSW